MLLKLSFERKMKLRKNLTNFMESVRLAGNLNIDMLNSMVSMMDLPPGTSPDYIETINDYLTKFIHRDDVNTFAIPALQSEISPKSKFYVFQAIRNFIKEKWAIQEKEFQESLKSFIFQFIIDIVNANLPIFLIKIANQTLVDLIILEWPQNWPNVLPDLLNTSSISPQICANIFDILNCLSIQVKEAEENYITIQRANEVKNFIQENIEMIISFILTTTSQQTDVIYIKAGLMCIKSYIEFLTTQQLFQTELIQNILNQYANQATYEIEVIEILSEVLSSAQITDETQQQFVEIFVLTTKMLYSAVGEDFSKAPQLLNDETFIHTFVTEFTQVVLRIQECTYSEDFEAAYNQIMQWMVYISANSSDDIFSLTLDYWVCVLRNVFPGILMEYLDLSDVVESVCMQLLKIFIERMPQPLVERSIIDDDERVHNIYQNSTSLGSDYFNAQQCVALLTNYYKQEMLSLINAAYEVIDINDLSSFPSLLWITGAVGSSLPVEDCEELFPIILQNLFGISNSTEDIQIKYLCAKGICFISWSFYKYLQQQDHYVILKAVISKILEFMVEEDSELQLHSIVALRYFSSHMKKIFWDSPIEGEKSLLYCIVESTDNILSHLMQEYVPDFYEALAIFVQGIPASSENFDITPLTLWGNVISKIEGLLGNAEIDEETKLTNTLTMMKAFIRISAFCKASNFPYLPMFLNNAIQLYLSSSETLQNSITETGLDQRGTLLLVINSQILTILDRMLAYGSNLEISKDIVMVVTLNQIIDDYFNLNPFARSPNIFWLLNSIIKKFPTDVTPFLPKILDKVYVPTMAMISDFKSFNEFRRPFSMFVASLMSRQKIIEEVGESGTDELLNCLKFFCNHQYQQVHDHGLNGIYNIVFGAYHDIRTETAALAFLEKNFMDIVFFLFGIILNISYKFSFDYQVSTIKNILGHDYAKAHAEEIFTRLCESTNVDPHFINSLLEILFGDTVDLSEARDALKTLVILVTKISPTDPDLNKEEQRILASQFSEKFKNIPGYTASNALSNGPQFDLAQNVSSISIKC